MDTAHFIATVLAVVDVVAPGTASAAFGALMLLDETEAKLGRLLSYPELP